MMKSLDNPIPLPASPLKEEVFRSLPFKGRVGVGMGVFHAKRPT